MGGRAAGEMSRQEQWSPPWAILSAFLPFAKILSTGVFSFQKQ